MIEEMTAAPNGVATTERPWLEVLGSRHFAGWLAEQNISLALNQSLKLGLPLFRPMKARRR